MEKFSHITEDGSVTMVDIAKKDVTLRKAVAVSTVYVNDKTFILLEQKALPKGDVLTVAKIAGIMGAKQTSALIPMCHPLYLSYMDIEFTLDETCGAIHIKATACTEGKTGVEMEALVAVQIAALTIYDMCKAVQKDIQIDACHLEYKEGGKSGIYQYKEIR
ncbi:MAG: cyclic pyranopterin monophosphate synthase MoaC [Desulfovibrionaceae bacterium]